MGQIEPLTDEQIARMIDAVQHPERYLSLEASSWRDIDCESVLMHSTDGETWQRVSGYWWDLRLNFRRWAPAMFLYCWERP